jgi:hypothetical protein
VYLLRAAIFDDSACFSSVTLCLSNLFAGDDVIILGLEAGVGSYTFLFTGRLISRLHTLYLHLSWTKFCFLWIFGHSIFRHVWNFWCNLFFAPSCSIKSRIRLVHAQVIVLGTSYRGDLFHLGQSATWIEFDKTLIALKRPLGIDGCPAFICRRTRGENCERTRCRGRVSWKGILPYRH